MDAENPMLNPSEIDAIGEVLNISMGSAATAVSTMLDRHVNITIPYVEVEKFEHIDFTSLEPAIIVTIEYVEGISGTNVMVFRQNDMQVILNLLMGNDEAPSDDFVFDELSMSAACEVMNQMMGSSATALSSFLGKTINISTPTAQILSPANTFKTVMGLPEDENIVSVSFNMVIEGVMKSDFISIMTTDLAKSIVSQAMGGQEAEIESLQVETPAAPAPAAAQPQQPAPPPAQPGTGAVAPGGAPSQPGHGQAGTGQPPYGQPPQQPQQPYGQPPYMQPPYGQSPYGQPPEGYYPPPGYPPYNPYYPPYGAVPPQQELPASPVLKQAVDVQTAQFPNFSGQGVLAAPVTSANMDLVMNVPLSVSVEIGKTKKKIKDIMDFAQGTVIELEKQAGAPVDIVVNGQLIARGDVVVIDDNFGVRVTEILGTKGLVAGLEKR